MGTAWSRWVDGDGAFDKTRYVDAHAQRLFFASLKLAVAAVERTVADEKVHTALAADATAANSDHDTDQDAMAQLQYVLENWARECGVLYDRVGDFPLILPLTSELRAATESDAASTSTPPQSRDELLLKAVSSDRLAPSERVYEAMYRVANKMPQDDFLRLVAQHPRATRLFVSQTIQAQLDAETPFLLYTSTNQHTKAAALVGKLAYGEESFVKKMGRLQHMASLLQRVEMASTSTPRERATASFQRVMTEEMIELLDTQNRLENRLGVMHLVGSSVIETIEKLLTLFPTIPTALATAAAVGEDFRVHPKQFWWCLIRALGANDQWRTLFVLSSAVPPPCGSTAIAEALIDGNRRDLTTELLASIGSAVERAAVIRFFSEHAPPEETGGGGNDEAAYGYVEDADAPVMV